jgi:hypothetical protein
LVDPEEVARLILFLAHAGNGLTGAAVTIDAGLSASFEYLTKGGESAA